MMKRTTLPWQSRGVSVATESSAKLASRNLHSRYIATSSPRCVFAVELEDFLVNKEVMFRARGSSVSIAPTGCRLALDCIIAQVSCRGLDCGEVDGHLLFLTIHEASTCLCEAIFKSLGLPCPPCSTCVQTKKSPSCQR